MIYLLINGIVFAIVIKKLKFMKNIFVLGFLLIIFLGCSPIKNSAQQTEYYDVYHEPSEIDTNLEQNFDSINFIQKSEDVNIVNNNYYNYNRNWVNTWNDPNLYFTDFAYFDYYYPTTFFIHYNMWNTHYRYWHRHYYYNYWEYNYHRHLLNNHRRHFYNHQRSDNLYVRGKRRIDYNYNGANHIQPIPKNIHNRNNNIENKRKTRYYTNYNNYRRRTSGDEYIHYNHERKIPTSKESIQNQPRKINRNNIQENSNRKTYSNPNQNQQQRINRNNIQENSNRKTYNQPIQNQPRKINDGNQRMKQNNQSKVRQTDGKR